METMSSSIKGIIIKEIDYKESSKIIYILTDIEIVSILCQGVKKINSKFRSQILLYNYVEVYTTGKKMPILSDILVIDELKNIKENITKYTFAGKLVNKLIKGIYDNKTIYEIALKTLMFINCSNEEYYYYLFMLKNLFYLGLGINFSCNCKENKKILGFNIKEGCAVCKSCNLQVDYDICFLLKIYDLYYSKLEDVIDVDIKELKFFLEKYYEYHLNEKI